jgi:hypothetical protein
MTTQPSVRGRSRPAGRPAGAACCALLPALLALVLPLASLPLTPAAAQPPGRPAAAPTPAPTPQSPAATQEDAADVVRKAEIMGSERWRRAIFELGEWLSAQPIYTPAQVRTIKANFNHKVARMSSHELEYLLDDLDAKFEIIDSPEARDARAWVGQYLSVMSDQKRAEALKDVPDVVGMTAGQLQQEIEKIEQKRASLQRQQEAFDAGRQQMVQQAQLARQQTAQASRAAMQAAASYSPYRAGGGGGGGGGGGKPPFSDVQGSGMSITSGPFGAYVSMNLGGF